MPGQTPEEIRGVIAGLEAEGPYSNPALAAEMRSVHALDREV